MHSLKKFLPLAAVLLAVCAVYSNHFQNGFHFDDAHTVVDNPAIRDLHNLPRFFVDATTFSVLPTNRTYRPMVSASLAVDYALGRGYRPFWFHLSTFFVYLLQLGAMYALFVAILSAARPAPCAHRSHRIVSLLALAWYGLHPAMAETVNYIVQRGDVFCAFGVVSALALFVRSKRWRKTGLYLLPLAFALLSKPPAAAFPLLLFIWIVLFEPDEPSRIRRAAISVAPALALTAAMLTLQSAMTPKTYLPSTVSNYAYCITQPFVLLRYFASFFLPIHLNVDTDLQPFTHLVAVALWGFAFVAALLAAAWFAALRRSLRPISFGLLWFLVASLPTSLYRLSEVENDHRMFLPFVGLALAVSWAIHLLLERVSNRRPAVMPVAFAAAVLLLSIYAYGAHVRNRVWRTDESLWLDDVQKCPHNGRGLMNYGLSQMAKGAYPAALDAFQRALLYTPNYPLLETNLGIVHAALNRPVEAEQHFQRALNLNPADDQVHFFYARWLWQMGRAGEAIRELQTVIALNPARIAARDLLAPVYNAMGDAADARATAEETLRLFPNDAAAAAILAHPLAQNADDWINASLYQYRSGNYAASILDANLALKLNPRSELAYNNLGAAYAALGQWDQAIQNEQKALRIRPDLTIARNNLLLYTGLKQQNAHGNPAAAAEDWLAASLTAYRAAQYETCIQDARNALHLRPDYAEAYNNIAAGYAAMGKWDDAIAAARKALVLKPDFPLAKNNLVWSEQQKSRQAR